MEDVLMELISKHGQIKLYNDKIEIIRIIRGARISKRRYENRIIFLDQITGIVFREYGSFSLGYISFTVPGNQSSTMGRCNVFSPLHDENTLVYDKEDTDLAKEIKKNIEELIANQSKTTENNTVPAGKMLSNDPDLIRKYKQLFDDGIITKEEYEVKKKEILGL
jgi:hypothetical protein